MTRSARRRATSTSRSWRVAPRCPPCSPRGDAVPTAHSLYCREQALAVACTARATAAAATHLASLERALHLLLQHLSSWAQPPEPAALQPAAPLTHAAAAAVARAPRALRAAAKRGDPSAPGEPSLAVCLSSLLQLAPAAAFARHEAQLALVHALARKALDLLSGEPVL